MQALRAAAIRWFFNFNCHSAFDPLLHVCLLGLQSVDLTLDRVIYFHMCCGMCLCGVYISSWIFRDVGEHCVL